MSAYGFACLKLFGNYLKTLEASETLGVEVLAKLFLIAKRLEFARFRYLARLLETLELSEVLNQKENSLRPGETHCSLNNVDLHILQALDRLQKLKF